MYPLPRQSAEYDGQPQISAIDYVFCNHSEENLARVTDAVLASDGDIIAIEKIREGSFGMGTAEEKRQLSERMTHFIAADSDITQPASEYFETDEPFFTQLLDSLKGSNKRIILIDMGTDDPKYSLYRKTRETATTYVAKIEEDQPQDEQWQTECDDLRLDYQIAAARENEYREFVMQSQITALVADNPGRKITVMAGAMHTPISYGISRLFDVTRIFVPAAKEAAAYGPGERMRFGRMSSQIRMLRLNLGRFGLSTLDKNAELIEA